MCTTGLAPGLCHGQTPSSVSCAPPSPMVALASTAFVDQRGSHCWVLGADPPQEWCEYGIVNVANKTNSW